MTSQAKKKLIKSEIETIPDKFIGEVLDFIRFLKYKNKLKRSDENRKTMIAFASENSLSKDWLKPEEDEAWKNL